MELDVNSLKFPCLFGQQNTECIQFIQVLYGQLTGKQDCILPTHDYKGNVQK